MKGASRGYFQAVILYANAHRAAATGVVSVAKDIGQSFPQRQWRIEWLVYSDERIRHKPSGYWQPVTHKPFCVSQKSKGIAAKLLIVQKLGAVNAPESGGP